MKRKFTMRFSALLLVLCMILSMLPTGLAENSSETGDYIFDLGRLRYGQWSDQGASPSQLTTWESLESLANWEKITTDPYMYYGQSEDVSWKWTSSSGMVKNGSRGPEIYGKAGDWVGLAVRVAQGGVFDVSVRYADYDNAMPTEFYLAPIGASDPMNEQYLIGMSSNKNIDKTAVKTERFATRYLPSGDYVFVTKVADSVSERSYAYTGALILEWKDDASEVLSVDASVNVGYIDKDTKVDLSVSLDGEAVALSELDVLRIDTFDGEVATVFEEDGEYYVHGVWEGETELYVDVQMGDEYFSTTVPIVIEMPNGYKRVDVVVGEQPDAYFMHDPIPVELTYFFNREEVSVSGNDVSVTVGDPTVAIAELDEESNLIITGKLSGETTVTVSATVNGATGTVAFPIVVGGVKYYYNFLKAYYGPWSSSAYSPDQITSFEQTTTGGKGEIIASDFKQKSDPWRYGGKGGMFDAGVTSSFKSYGYLAGGGPGDWICFQILVAEGGTYSLDIVYGKQVWGSAFDIYFSPEGTPESELINEKYYMARILTESTGTSLDNVKSVGNVTLEPGVYNVVWQLAKDTLVGYGGMMTGIRLSAIEKDDFRIFTPTPDAVMETTEDLIPLTAIWNGVEVDFADVTDLEVQSANEKIATAEIVSDGDTASVKLYGVSAGKTTLTVSGVRNGASASYKFSVDIAEKKRIYSVDLQTETPFVDAGESIETVLTGVNYDGTPIDFDGCDIYYESLNFDVAGVDENGVVTTKKKGEATIRVWVQQGETLLHASVTVGVGIGKVTGVELNLADQILRGKTTQLSVNVTTSSGEVLGKDLYDVVFELESAEPAGCVRMSTSGTSIQGRTLGTATLKATVTVNSDVFVVRKTVEIVNQLPESGDGDETDIPNDTDPEKILLKLDRTEIGVGESIAPELGVYNYAGALTRYSEDDSDLELVYDKEILKFENGMFVALKSGETVVTLRAGEISESVSISVTDEVLGSVIAECDGVLYQNDTVEITVEAKTNLGRKVLNRDLTVSFASANTSVASVNADGVVSGVSCDETTITVTVQLAGATAVAVVPVKVVENEVESISLTAPITVMKPDSAEGIQTSISVVSASGDIRSAEVSEVSYESLSPEILSVDENGLVLPVGNIGEGTIRATFVYHDKTLTSELELLVKEGKTESTYFTKKRRAAIKENAGLYDWAKTTYNSVDEAAKQWLGREDEILSYMTTNELPRSIWTGFKYDPDYHTCDYCGVNIIEATGNAYPWKFDYNNYPWKLQCPVCMRRFPSNDFWEFYQTGIDEHGNWSYELAKEKGSHLLTNDNYPEKDEHIDKNGVLQNEGIHGWGVDDGYGYKNGIVIETQYGTKELADTYISYYNHWANWYSGGLVYQANTNLMYGYVYTGDVRYGRIVALMADRVADLYPEMNTGDFLPDFNNNGWFGGKIVGGIWETSVNGNYVRSYDAAFDLFDDPYVLQKIREKDEKYNLPIKETGNDVRQHIEDNLIRETRAALYDKRINGNSGMHQFVAVNAAVVLDNMPESKELIDWAMYGFGEIIPTLVSGITREGQGTECSPSYNNGWVNLYSDIADVLGAYESYQEINLYTNPRYLAMLKMNLPLTMTRNTTLHIGDIGGFATTGLHFDAGAIGSALVNGCDDPELAQILYFMNGNSASGPNGRSIMISTSELEEKIRSLIDEYGEYDFDQSTQMTGYGVGILRGGTFVKGNIQNINSQRSVSLWYGGDWGHSQDDCLSLMMDAYGLNVLPAMGYPTDTSGTNRSVNWEAATISHNTVVVNDDRQQEQWYVYGDPLHFDDSGRVKLVDAQHNSVYAHQGVSKYRRTAVMVEVNEEDAYTLDFFRVVGGNSHTYSFHAQSNTISGYEGIKPVEQAMGTYAGPDVPFGPGVLKSGYDALYDVKRAVHPGNEFAVEFKIEDFRKVLKENREIYLRMTQLNDFELSDVSIATGNPPFTNDNPTEIKYVLARREGTNLDSLFTTVIEPYDKNRFIDKIESVTIDHIGGTKTSEPAKAVKVTLKNGREDYVVYSGSNKARYRVDDRFDFIGYVGVVSYMNDEIVYRYMHDSTMLAGMYYDAEATGKVVSFTKGLANENFINVRLDKSIDADELNGKTIFVNNGGSGSTNGAYWIRSVTENYDGTVSLGLNNVTLVRSQDTSGNYVYNIAEGQTFRIPLTSTADGTPVIEPVPNQVVTVGDTLEVPIVAVSPIGRDLTYRIARDVIGASMQDNVFCFSPQGTQENVAVEIEVTDGINTASVVFNIEVYGTNSAGGGGGGGGSDEPEEEVTYEDLGDNIFKDSNGNLIDAGPDKIPGTPDDKPYEEVITPTEKFVDLGGHAWAKDAIYRLVDAGVIKGVSDDQFAPGNQITRADFAILLVRAWNLTADDLGAFEDVLDSDYFAREVGIASAFGIVNGVGDSKFAPKDPITREQMMVMLSRTLEAVKAEVKEAPDDILADFTDADLISDYAVESVKSMVAGGFIQGANGKINPQGNATRAEVAVLLDRILSK